MDTNKLKKFAVEARNKIKAGVEAKLSTLGFDAKGNVPNSMMPQLMQGGSLWNGQLMTEGFYHQWMALYDAVKRHGVRDVYEEAAYTWFNRLVAIRILQKNDLISPVLSYADDARTPQIVDDARSLNRIPPMPEADRQRLMDLLDDDTKVTEQFAILITAYCHDNPIIRNSFGRMADYTELLLPNNILAENGFIDDLNHTEFITDEDFRSSQLIGWLYQFYISERKDEVFAKKGKYDADEIAPATQIFTPAWIVEYMVQNTLGRIYLDNHPDAADEFKPKWKYLVDQEPTNEARADIQARLDSALQGGGSQRQQRDDEHFYHFDELTELRCADLGCGSGHIVGYMFELLFDLYLYEGYTRKEAVENILKYNLTGVDLDLRAKQLATFALLLKACQKDPSFTDGRVMPNVLTMPEPIDESKRQNLFHEFFQGEETNNMLAELNDAFDLLKDAQTLGSIMKFDLSKSTLLAIRQTMEYWEGQSIVTDSVKQLVPSFKLILALTEDYTVLVMNPPYMGSGRFDRVLSDYVKANYDKGKADLFSVFMLMAQDRLAPNGKYAMINMQSWMFISAFENLREDLLDSMQIDSLLHLGPHTFDELGGEVVQNVAFIVSNSKSNGLGVYYRLVDGKDCSEKEIIFKNNISSNQSNNNKIYFPQINQREFDKIPGKPIGYWLSSRSFDIFDDFESLNDFLIARVGLITGDSNRFIRNWQEVSIKRIGFNIHSNEESILSKKRWFPIHNGGTLRKWYGNLTSVVNWENDGYEMKFDNFQGKRVRSHNYNGELAFKESFSWNTISSDKFTCRYAQEGFMFDTAGPFAQVKEGLNSFDLLCVMAYLNTKIANAYLNVINPTVNFPPGSILSLPYCITCNVESIYLLSKNCIVISKLDWDSHEISWNFSENPLVAFMKSASTGENASSVKIDSNQCLNGSQKIPNQAAKDTQLEAKRVPFASQKIQNRDGSDNQQVTETDLGESCKDISYGDDAAKFIDEYNEEIETLKGLCSPADGVQLHGSTLETAVKAFEKLWTARFMQLHANEEELNRQFIDIYGLQDELTPDVPLDEITILQQGEISIKREQSPNSFEAMPSADEIGQSQIKIKDNNIVWNEDILVKQLISYAVGVCMGRYRLDKSGLHIAYPKPSAEDLAAYDYNGKKIVIDDDGIIPLLPHDSPFSDNMVNRLSTFIGDVFGEDYLAENLNYMESCLGETLEKYLIKDYWKDHKKMYQNRPIYWLFSSKKGAFKCIAYMHRMDAYTAERVRSKYLLPYIDFLQRSLTTLDNRSAELSTAENRQREQLRKTLDECREYHDRLQVVAERAISFDLDDGVVVNYAKFGDVLAKIK